MNMNKGMFLNESLISHKVDIPIRNVYFLSSPVSQITHWQNFSKNKLI